MKMEQTQCSETSAIKHHTPGNNPKGYTQFNFTLFIYVTRISRYILEFGIILGTWNALPVEKGPLLYYDYRLELDNVTFSNMHLNLCF
jgi:hypothetical protein